MIVLNGLSALFKKQGINMHASFIFMAVLLVHLIIGIKKVMPNEKRKLLRQLFMLVLLLSIVKVALLEFYHAIKTVDMIYGILLIILIVAFIYTAITDRISKKKEEKRKMEEVIKKEGLKEAEVLDTVDIPIDESQESTEEDSHNPVEEEKDEK
jgi:Ca2+/Na+ antiporter